MRCKLGQTKASGLLLSCAAKRPLATEHFDDSDAQKQPPAKPRIWSTGALVPIFVALAIALLQRLDRGGFSGLVASPIASSAQQLKLGEIAFKNGNDAVALKLFDQLAAKNDVTAEYWLAHMSELGLGVPKDIPKAISLSKRRRRRIRYQPRPGSEKFICTATSPRPTT